MAITRGTTLSSTKISVNSTDGSITHEVDANTSLLLVYIGTEGNESVSGTPQWSLGGGENLTLIDTFGTSTSAADCIGHWYGLLNPTAGAGTVSITFASNCNPAITMAANYIGTIEGAMPTLLSEDINDTASATNVHASAGTAGNALVVGTHFQGDDGATPTDNASFFDVFNDTTGGSSSADFTFFWGDILEAAGATAVTVTYQATDENTGAYIEIVVGDSKKPTPTIGSLALTGAAPTVSLTSLTLPTTDSLTLAGKTPVIQSLIWINSSATKDGNEVLLPNNGTQTATLINFDDTAGAPTGTVFIGVEKAAGQIAWSAAQTVNVAGGNHTVLPLLGTLAISG